MDEEHSRRERPLPSRPRRARHRRWWAVILLIALIGARAVAYFVKAENKGPRVAKQEAGPAVDHGGGPRILQQPETL